MAGQIGIVGAGFMGSGIAESAARGGYDVLQYEPDAAVLERSRERIGKSLARAEEAGKLEGVSAASVLTRITPTTTLDALGDAEIVIEAVYEDAQVKSEVFAELDRLVPAAIPLASNTSSIPIARLAAASLMAAVRMLEEGFAGAEDIDLGMQLGAGHPMGPLTLCDFIGLDVLQAVCDSLYDEFKRPDFAAPPMLKRLVEAGHLGRKSGRGFYDYAR